MEQIYNLELRMRILTKVGRSFPEDSFEAADMLKRVEKSLRLYSPLLQENPRLEGRLIGVINRAIKNNKFYRAMNVLDKFFSKYIPQPVGVN